MGTSDGMRYKGLFGKLFDNMAEYKPPLNPWIWTEAMLPIPRKCGVCKTSVWGKGVRGVQYGYAGNEHTWRHTACHTVAVLGENA